MLAVARSVVRRLGYDITRYVPPIDQPLNLLKLAIEARLFAGLPVTVLQIGAHDGQTDDPLHDLIVRHRLPGLLVEPLPDVFAKLEATYAGQSHLRLARCAVGLTDGTAEIYRVKPAPGLPAWLQEIASFDPTHLTARKFGFPNLERYVVAEPVPVVTLPSLLKTHPLPTVDVLQVDTEGFDTAIVESALGMGLRPAIINYEFIHTRPDQRVRCKRALAAAGYQFADSGRDTTAVLHSPAR